MMKPAERVLVLSTTHCCVGSAAVVGVAAAALCCLLKPSHSQASGAEDTLDTSGFSLVGKGGMLPPSILEQTRNMACLYTLLVF